VKITERDAARFTTMSCFSSQNCLELFTNCFLKICRDGACSVSVCGKKTALAVVSAEKPKSDPPRQARIRTSPQPHNQNRLMQESIIGGNCPQCPEHHLSPSAETHVGRGWLETAEKPGGSSLRTS